MNTKGLAELLKSLIEDVVVDVDQNDLDEAGEEDDLDEVGEGKREVFLRVQSYADAGVLTTDAGFVIQMSNREFQVTIVRSR